MTGRPTPIRLAGSDRLRSGALRVWMWFAKQYLFFRRRFQCRHKQNNVFAFIELHYFVRQWNRWSNRNATSVYNL